MYIAHAVKSIELAPGASVFEYVPNLIESRIEAITRLQIVARGIWRIELIPESDCFSLALTRRVAHLYRGECNHGQSRTANTKAIVLASNTAQRTQTR